MSFISRTGIKDGTDRTMRIFLVFKSALLLVHRFVLARQVSVCLSIHPFIHPSIHQCIHPLIHQSIHQSIHSFIHPSIHQSIHSFIHPSTYPFIRPSIHSSVNPSINQSIQPSSTHPLIHQSIHPLIRRSIHSTPSTNPLRKRIISTPLLRSINTEKVLFSESEERNRSY